MITLETVWSEAAQQRVYRRLLQALARPGTIADLADLDLGAPAWTAVLACLGDEAVTLADPLGLLDARTRGLLGMPSSGAAEAAFVIAVGSRPPPAGLQPRNGTLLDPELGATLVLTVDALGQGRGLDLRGPGIATTTTLGVGDLDPAWIALRHRLDDAPRGIDLVLVDRTRCACLPRTTRISGGT